MNFTFQDLLGSAAAFITYPLVMLFPGYVIGWMLDLFDFRKRQLLTRHVIAIVVSVALTPILVYLFSLLTSFVVTKSILVIFALAYAVHLVSERSSVARDKLTEYQRLALIVAVGWVFFSIVSLVDLQSNDRLYNNIVSLDFATRVTMVNAITRTGVPPVNPSYFPGHPEYTTSVYYFWYVLCSIVDQFGGNWIDSRAALIAGDAWCGLALMATIALYLRLRSHEGGIRAWKSALVGASFLAISGLDVIPALTSMIVSRYSNGFVQPAGDLEHWNEQITAWVGSLFWVPHHVAAMIACLVGLLLFQYVNSGTYYRPGSTVLMVGLSFASAIGLSTWVAIIFAVFWGVWILILIIQKRERRSVSLMIMAGICALILASPFLDGVIRGGTGASGLPFAIEVRRFRPVFPYINDQLSSGIQNIIYFVLLPVNYLMELGFFLVAGLLWLQRFRSNQVPNNSFLISEITLLCVVVFVCSFVRSAILTSNELGWRGWLFGQFILLVWAVDIHSSYPFLRWYQQFKSPHFRLPDIGTKRLMLFLLVIGFSTTVIDVALLRFWPLLVDKGIAGFPNGLSPDMKLGQRTLGARLAYDFIRDELPLTVVVQYNPLNGIDRPSGLYGTRQIAISANARYNVPSSVLTANIERISKIFILEQADSWEEIDLLCRENYIDVLVVNDLDPLWRSLRSLRSERPTLYENGYYAVFACGNFAETR